MKLTFDYYHNLEQVDLFLCNPDGRELFPLPGKSRKLTLRFNDLSELAFEVDANTTLSDGTVVQLEAYDYIQTKRLVYATSLGWFQISGVDEHDNGIAKYKSVTAESYQAVLKNKGFLSEERVYCFYNQNDPYDEAYDPSNEASIPSVLGQINKQLGIRQDLAQGLDEPDSPYDEWTVTYINPSLVYDGENGICRTFKENTTFGYDWIVNDVEEAFKVVVVFDFMNKAICVMTPTEVAQNSGVVYTFSNFMKSIDVKENDDDIVTVLNCSGDNCGIATVNPTGTNYICDFSYYMDEVRYRWMSKELIEKLKSWESACKDEKDTYANHVKELRELWRQHTELMTDLQDASIVLQDLKNAQAKRSVVGNGTPGSQCGIVHVESVFRGETSVKNDTAYFSTPFIGETRVTAYQSQPTYDPKSKKWVFSGSSKSGTIDEIVAFNLSDDNTTGISYWYFSDVNDGSSYCKLQSSAKINKDDPSATYSCGGFERYIAYCYPTVAGGTGAVTYTDDVQLWIDLREKQVNDLNTSLYGYPYQTEEPKLNSICWKIKSKNESLNAISSRLNILSYFADTPSLLRELNCYWIEGDYRNENISVLESTTPEQEIDLSNELLESGRVELSKMCQPHFSFSIESIDATKQYEFRHQMRALELGKIVAVEKEDAIWYYPALLEISMNLDDADDFTMAFANAMRLDDWGYTYADLIAESSSRSRQVSANWQDILAYAKEKEEISSLIKDPFDSTLRASFANMVNQDFVIDKNGILGRKRLSETSEDFEEEQVRLINNLLIFTDDNWKTAKTALGKITYKEGGQEKTSYGLIAETIIGSLIMGEKLMIHNKDSTVNIDGSGIVIKKPVYSDDGKEVVDYTTMFEADSQTGRLFIHEAEIVGNINGGTINIGSGNFIVNSDGEVTIKKGGINIADNFIVNNDGNVQINGSIVWGTGSSPTQVVYSQSTREKPSNGTQWSSFPASDNTGWHTQYASNDYFASYTYDGGNTWTDPIQIIGRDGGNGANGDTIRVVYLYYRKSNSIAPSKPTYAGSGDMPTGWSSQPQGVTASYPYVFVSQCTVTNGSYGAWSTPTCWAKYGSDASVTTTNMFNAVTDNGTKQGCFVLDNGALAINAAYIKAGQVDANLVLTGQVDAQNIIATGGKIGNWILNSSQLCNYDGKRTANDVTYYDNSFCMRTTSEGQTTLLAIGSVTESNWSLANFRVEKDGSVYANKGEIGGMVINGGELSRLAAGGSDSNSKSTMKLNGEGFSISYYHNYHDLKNYIDWTGFFAVQMPNDSGPGSKVCIANDGIWFSRYPNTSGSTAQDADKVFGIGIAKKTCIELYDKKGSSLAKLLGTWYYGTSGSAYASARCVKDNISVFDERHDLLFDKLIPRTFTYTQGESGRTHYGYILDELRLAMDEANINANECGAYCLFDVNNPDGEGGIRYGEFVALNTWQIQKLKERVAYLEEVVCELLASKE